MAPSVPVCIPAPPVPFPHWEAPAGPAPHCDSRPSAASVRLRSSVRPRVCPPPAEIQFKSPGKGTPRTPPAPASVRPPPLSTGPAPDSAGLPTARVVTAALDFNHGSIYLVAGAT